MGKKLDADEESFTESPSKMSFRKLSCSCISLKAHQDVSNIQVII
jgi:hypothetical protein